MQQYHEDLLIASPVSASEVKSNRTKLIASTLTESEGLMMILKIFTNLFFELFPSPDHFTSKST